MPEAPDLEVIKDVLNRRVRGLAISGARVLKPLELRVLATDDFVLDVTGRSILGFTRRGKFLIGDMSDERTLGNQPHAHRRSADLLAIDPYRQADLVPA